mgnify:CR=1 FL=1
MKEDDPQRYCKECGADWLGKKIPKESLHYYNSPPGANEKNWFEENEQFKKDILAGAYDDKPELLKNTHFSRRIALYSREVDRTTAYQCPDCGHVVGREPKQGS